MHKISKEYSKITHIIENKENLHLHEMRLLQEL